MEHERQSKGVRASWLGLMAVLAVCGCDKKAEQASATPSASAAVGSASPAASTPPAAAPSASAPPPAAPAPTVVAKDQNRPVAVAVDANNVYWVNSGVDENGKLQPNLGSVVKAPRDGGEAFVIASKQDAPGLVVADGKNVYWTYLQGVRKAPASGGAASTLYKLGDGAGAPSALALGEKDLYLGVLHFTKGGVFKISTGGGGAALAGGAADSGFAAGPVARVQDRVVVCNADGSVMGSVTLPTKYFRVVFERLDGCNSMVADEEAVYWTSSKRGKVSKLPWRMLLRDNPTTSVSVVSNAEDPHEVVSYGEELFWVEKRAGRIMRAPKTGGETRVVVANLKAPQGLAVSDGTVFWSEPDEGTVSKLVFDPDAAAKVPAPAASSSTDAKTAPPRAALPQGMCRTNADCDPGYRCAQSGYCFIQRPE